MLWSVGLLESEKNPLNYTERKEIIRKIFPNITIVWIADVKTDDEWMDLLEDLIRTKFKVWLSDVLFYWWSRDDTRYYHERNLKCEIVDRNIWECWHVSASIVRDRIKKWENLSWLVDEKIIEEVEKIFKEKKEKIQNKVF